jgi:hypothetical protein
LSPRLWPFNGSRPQQDLHALVPSDAIAGLLSEADEQEALLQHNDTGARFDVVLQEIAAEAEPQPHVTDGPVNWPDTAGILPPIDAVLIEPIPAPTRKPERFEAPSRLAPKLAVSAGDLIFVFGLRDDALTVARAMAVATPTIEVAVAGTVGKPGSRHVGDRREALQARADGVRRGGSTLVAIGLGEAPTDAARYAGILHDVIPDQVWIAVDVTRKPEDTRVWAHLVADAGGGIDAIAAIGTAYTTTPDSTAYLGIPVGWGDGY